MTDTGSVFPRTDGWTPSPCSHGSTPRVEGHGIGLGTVARTVIAFGGRVGTDEAPGGGAEVWFELPASSDL